MLTAVMVPLLIVTVVAACIAIGTGRAYAQPATTTVEQLGVNSRSEPAIGDHEIEQGAATLEQLAHANFGDLSDAELKLVHAAPQRALLWVGPNNDADSAANDPSNAS